MKTFTTYAEKKAKQILNLLQGYTKGIRITAILILLLMGVSNVWAASTVQGGHIYFDELNSGYTGAGDMQFWVGHSSYSSSYSMSRITNTKLWYCSAPNWGDATYFAFTSGANWGAANQKYYDRIGSNPWKSATKESYALDSSNKFFVFRVASTANKAAVISDSPYGYQGTSYTSLNKTITIKAKVSTNGGSSYSETSTPAKLTGSSKVFTSTSSCTGTSGASATLNAGSSSTTFKAGYTANTTLTAVAATGYTFEGWYSGSTKVSDDNLTVTVNPTGETTYYAYYKKNQYTVNFGVHSAGNGTLTAKAGSTNINTGAKVNHGSSITFTASPTIGYRVQGWYSDANCTNSLNNGTDKTYTINSLTTNANVYVKYEEIPEDKFTVTIQPNNANYGTVSPSGSPQVGASGIEIEATAEYGYKFDQWTKTGSVTIEDTSDPTTVIKATGTGTVTATFVEDLATTKWYISGNGNGSGNDLTPGSPFTGWATNGIQMFKKSGHSTEEIYYCTITANTIASSDDHFPFKVYNATTSKYWGNSGYWVTKENNSPTLSSNSGDNMKFRPYLTGTYEFKLDATNASSPVLTVTWPVYNQLRISAANPADATNTGNFDMTGSGTYTVTRSLKANTTYTFKIVYNSDWYGVNSGNLTRASATKTLSTSGGDLTIKTDVAGNYTFTFNGSTKALTVTYPTAYTVTYGVGTNKGTDEVTTNPSISSGSLVLASTSITFSKSDTKAGYTWKNWNSKADGTGTNLGTGDTYVSSNRAGDITVYACYDLITYNITYNLNGGSGASNTTYNVESANITLPTAPTKTGYTFAGWYDNANLTGNNVTQIAKGSTGDKTFYAKWTANTYTVKFNANGGSGSMADQTFTYNEEEKALTANTFTQSGYDFVGWNTLANGTGTSYTDSQKVQNLTDKANGTITLYAQWKAQSFELTWDANGGKITTPGSPEGGEVEAGTPLKAPILTKEHYDHTGWTPEEPTVMPGKDVTYIAQWTPTLYNITYNTNGGNTITKGTYTIETETFDLPTPTKTGSEFAGWFENAEFTGNAVASITKGTTGDKTFYAKWNTGTFTVTLDMQSGEGGTTSVQAIYGDAMPKITVPTRTDHLFDGYYDQTGGKGTKYYNADGTSAKNWNKETATLYAKWIPYSQCIFFKNTLDWENVYIYTFTDNAYWNDGTGVHPATNKLEQGKMTQVGKTDIYYYILTSSAGFNHIAFSDYDMRSYELFNDHKAIYRGDRSNQMPLFIPQKDQTPTGDTYTTNKYYSSGIWMKYNSTESGYKWSSDKNSWSTDVNPFTASAKGGYTFTTTVSLSGNTTYLFKVNNIKGDWYSKVCTITQDECTNLWFQPESDPDKNAVIQPNVTGNYVFTVYLGDGKVEVSLDYPLGVGDYRLDYRDNTPNWHHPSHYIKKKEEGSNDTISFFIHSDKEPQVIVQRCTNVTNAGETEWEDVNLDINPAASITESGVYNFVLQQVADQDDPILVAQAHPYTGNYYIRTDAAAGGWDAFRQDGNKMTYSSYASKHTHFNHYFCSWITSGRNVKYTIANDYSLCISDTLNGDAIIGNTGEHVGYLPADANVRFGWNSTNNELERAYIAGSGVVSDRFLVLIGDEKLTDLGGEQFNISGLDENEAIFADMGNWIYQLDAKAGKGASIQLIATYNKNEQTFFNTSSVALMEEGNNDTYPVRFIYDFKTNNLMAAWLLLEEENDVQGGSDLNANMLLMRKHHKPAQQIQLANTLTAVGTAYGVMTFDKYFLNNRYSEGANIGKELPENERKSIYERALYWVSFPFDVCIRDVFGFGEYMDTWIMEYYDGAARAENGAWADSESYWTYITDVNYVLKAGVGYVLCLDLDKMAYNSSVWANTAEVSLYFPSVQPIGTIEKEQAVAITVPAHECKINRETPLGDRRIADSNWNVIGVPRFINLNIELPEYDAEKVGTINQDNVLYYYSYNPVDNSYTVAESGNSVFQTMQAYMVQYAGTINWWEMASWPPQQIAARRNGDAGPEQVSFRLELAQDDITADKTFIQLQEEGATADFDMNKDLTKILNAGANIYTLVGEGNVLTAGNVLPMNECEIPVGVKVATDGEYTFRMPDGTEGMVVEFIDYYTNTRTNMLTHDYTVELSAGTSNDRFALHIQPEKSGVTTDIDQLTGGELNSKGVQKFIIDGKLIIRTAEGEVFDAQGHRL